MLVSSVNPINSFEPRLYKLNKFAEKLKTYIFQALPTFSREEVVDYVTRGSVLGLGGVLALIMGQGFTSNIIIPQERRFSIDESNSRHDSKSNYRNLNYPHEGRQKQSYQPHQRYREHGQHFGKSYVIGENNFENSFSGDSRLDNFQEKSHYKQRGPYSDEIRYSKPSLHRDNIHGYKNFERRPNQYHSSWNSGSIYRRNERHRNRGSPSRSDIFNRQLEDIVDRHMRDKSKIAESSYEHNYNNQGRLIKSRNIFPEYDWSNQGSHIGSFEEELHGQIVRQKYSNPSREILGGSDIFKPSSEYTTVITEDGEMTIPSDLVGIGLQFDGLQSRHSMGRHNNPPITGKLQPIFREK